MTKASKEEIVAAARELFRQSGYAGTSMQDIADRVGLRKASLYSRFADKDALVPAVLDSVLAELFPPEDEADWRKAYRQAVQRLADHLVSHRRCVGLHLAYGLPEDSPGAKLAAGFFRSCRQRLTAMLVQGMDPSAAERLATETLSRIEGATLWLVVDGDSAPLRQAVAALTAQADGDLSGKLAAAEERIYLLEQALRGQAEAAACFL